jgi:hypothetical protein
MFDQILKANLIGDDRELFYLLEFLQVTVDLDIKPATTSEMAGQFRETYKQRKYTFMPQVKMNVLKKMKSYEEKKKPKTEEMGENPESMMEEEINQKDSEIEIFEEDHVESLKRIAKCTTSLSRLLDTTGKDIDFTLVTLPENFYDSYHGFIYKSCDLCHQRTSQNDLVLCMLCGTLMCTHVCGSNKDKKKSKLYLN